MMNKLEEIEKQLLSIEFSTTKQKNNLDKKLNSILKKLLSKFKNPVFGPYGSI